MSQIRRTTRSITRCNTSWHRLPLELREMIVLDLLEANIPTKPRSENEQAHVGYENLLKKLGSITKDFTRDDLLAPLLKTQATLLKLLTRVLETSSTIIIAAQTSYSEMQRLSNGLGDPDQIRQAVSTTSRLMGAHGCVMPTAKHLTDCFQLISNEVDRHTPSQKKTSSEKLLRSCQNIFNNVIPDTQDLDMLEQR